MSAIKLKRASTASWESHNPTLESGQPGVEFTTSGNVRLKIGDGSTPWDTLPYIDNDLYLPLSGGTLSGRLTANNGLTASTVSGVTTISTDYNGTLTIGSGGGAPTVIIGQTSGQVILRSYQPIQLQSGSTGNTFTNVRDPEEASEVATKNYVDTKIAGISISDTGEGNAMSAKFSGSFGKIFLPGYRFTSTGTSQTINYTYSTVGSYFQDHIPGEIAVMGIIAAETSTVWYGSITPQLNGFILTMTLNTSVNSGDSRTIFIIV